MKEKLNMPCSSQKEKDENIDINVIEKTSNMVKPKDKIFRDPPKLLVFITALLFTLIVFLCVYVAGGDDLFVNNREFPVKGVEIVNLILLLLSFVLVTGLIWVGLDRLLNKLERYHSFDSMVENCINEFESRKRT